MCLNWNASLKNQSSICAQFNEPLFRPIHHFTTNCKTNFKSNFPEILHSIRLKGRIQNQYQVLCKISFRILLQKHTIKHLLPPASIPKVQLNSRLHRLSYIQYNIMHIYLFSLAQPLISHIRTLHTTLCGSIPLSHSLTLSYSLSHTRQMVHNECSVHLSTHFYVFGMSIKQAWNIQTGQSNHFFFFAHRRLNAVPVKRMRNYILPTNWPKQH